MSEQQSCITTAASALHDSEKQLVFNCTSTQSIRIWNYLKTLDNSSVVFEGYAS